MTWTLLALILGQDLGAALAAASPNSIQYVGYEVPMQAGQGTICGWSSGRQSKLMLEGPRRLRILIEVDHGKPGKLQLASEDCTIEPGSLKLRMLESISPSDSIRFLASRDDDQSIFAISLHADPKATETLIAMARDSSNAKRQRKAFFWLARSRDPAAERFLERILR